MHNAKQFGIGITYPDVLKKHRSLTYHNQPSPPPHPPPTTLTLSLPLPPQTHTHSRLLLGETRVLPHQPLPLREGEELVPLLLPLLRLLKGSEKSSTPHFNMYMYIVNTKRHNGLKVSTKYKRTYALMQFPCMKNIRTCLFACNLFLFTALNF